MYDDDKGLEIITAAVGVLHSAAGKADDALAREALRGARLRLNRILDDIGKLPPRRAIFLVDRMVLPFLRHLKETARRVEAVKAEPEEADVAKVRSSTASDALDAMIAEALADVSRDRFGPGFATTHALEWAVHDFLKALDAVFGSRHLRARCSVCKCVYGAPSLSELPEDPRALMAMAATGGVMQLICPACGRGDKLSYYIDAREAKSA